MPILQHKRIIWCEGYIIVRIVTPSEVITSRFRKIAIFESSLVILVSFLVLVGWQFGIEILKRVAPSFVAMNPLTAICFLASAAAILLLHSENRQKSWRWAGYILGAGVVLVGLGILLRYGWNVRFWLDRAFYAAELDKAGLIPNRMAPNSALNFILVGLAVLLIDVRTKSKHAITPYLAAATSFFALFSLLGYAYGIYVFISVGGYIPIAINTAMCFLLLATAILFSRPQSGIMFIFSTDKPAGYLARRLFLAAILLQVIFGWIRIQGQHASLYSAETGIALFVANNIVLFSIIIWISTNSLYERDVEVERVKDEFLGLATHQLQTPLTGIKLSLAMLRDGMDGKLNSGQLKLVEEAISSNDRERRIVNDLLNVARADAGRFILDLKPVDLNTLLTNIIMEQRPTINQRKQKITVTTQELVANVDSAKLRMALENLLSNATKYTPDGGKLGVKLKKVKGKAIVVISDNGVGIDQSDFPRIFDKFIRIDNPLSEERDGTGLGLYLVKQIVELHGGEVMVASKLGKGTEFTVALPI